MPFAEKQPQQAAEIGIRPFRPGDEAAFRRLNEEWIARFFFIEPMDELVLTDPQRTILDLGGRIFFATAGDRCIGCCGLIRTGDKEFEVAKMAVEPSFQGFGIGRRLLQAVIDEGRRSDAVRLTLETNHVLTTAIHLYKSLGFKHIDAGRVAPSPFARADVHMELILS